MFAVLPKPEDSLKASYSVTLRNSLFLAISFHVLLLLFSPPFEFKPYVLPTPEKPIVVTNVAEIIIPPPPPEVKMPSITIPTGPDDDGEEIEIPENVIDGFTSAPIPKREPPTQRGFVAIDVLPIPVLMVKPAYPRLAREAGIEGTVLIKVVVNETGKVVEASVVSSDVIPDMDNAALKAARQCLFEPAKQNSVPVPVTVVVPFEFRLIE